MAVNGVRRTDLKPKPTRKGAKGGAKGGSKGGAKGIGKGVGKGKGKGKGGKAETGTWAWIPTGPVKGGKGAKGKGKGKVRMNTPVYHAPVMRTKGKGKGKGKGTVKGKGKGKGKGKNADRPDNKFLEKLQDVDASLKVWVGGLDEKLSWKTLTGHFKDIGKAKVALMPKGKACLAFKTADEVDNAIATLNGSELGGKTIEVDVWTQKEKREPGEKREKKQKLVKTGFAAKVAKGKAAKGSGKGKAKTASKFLEKLRAMDRSLKVWVGSLTDNVTIKMLKHHFEDLGCKCEVAEFMKPGTACVGFETADEAESAVAALSGSDLDGQSMKVSAWKK